MSLDLGTKWVGLLHELLPSARRFAVLVNIETADAARSLITSVQEGALPTGLQTEIVFASTASELEPAFAGLGARAQALIVHPDVLFLRNREPLAALAIREKLATISTVQGFAQAGGLLSYGSDFVEAHHQAGLYVARILKGEKPGDLPVQRATKFNLVINLKTAKTIGLNIPAMFQARADEVIE
jgi:putative ABC transport system substrate-binding protein